MKDLERLWTWPGVPDGESLHWLLKKRNADFSQSVRIAIWVVGLATASEGTMCISFSADWVFLSISWECFRESIYKSLLPNFSDLIRIYEKFEFWFLVDRGFGWGGDHEVFSLFMCTGDQRSAQKSPEIRRTWRFCKAGLLGIKLCLGFLVREFGFRFKLCHSLSLCLWGSTSRT